MDRFKQLDVTQSSIGAVLRADEEVVSLQDGVGLYDGKEKTLDQKSGTVYLTTHRLIYVDDEEPHRHSCFLELGLVKQTEYYAGFLKSSPKVTLQLAPPGRHEGFQPAELLQGPRDWRSEAAVADSNTQTTSSWICRVCGFSNPTAGALEAIAPKCQLCGVARDSASEASTSSQRPSPRSNTPLGRLDSLPSSLSSLALSASPSLGVRRNDSPFGSPTPGSRPSSTHISPSNAAGLACPTCTFLNHPSMVKCEMCDTPLGQLDPPSLQNVERQPAASLSELQPRDSFERDSRFGDVSSRPSALPSRTSNATDSVRLSFRRGGDKAFYSITRSTLQAKAWASSASDTGFNKLHAIAAGAPGKGLDVDGRSVKRRVGIDGIMSAVDSSERTRTGDMQDALRDLEALMTKAKHMVDLAESLNAKLTRQEQLQKRSSLPGSETAVPAPDPEAANLIRSSLVRLGLPTPAVTPDMIKDEEEYHEELARELGGLLLGLSPSTSGLMGNGRVLGKGKARETLPVLPESGRGLVGLDEVWCVWNRARGVALVPPQALRSAAEYLPLLTSPRINVRTFRSGLAVLHTPRYGDEAFSQRVTAFLQAQERAERLDDTKSIPASIAEAGIDDMRLFGSGATTMDIALAENAPVALVAEMVEVVESTGAVVRDDGSKEGTRWFVNRITEYRWE